MANSIEDIIKKYITKQQTNIIFYTNNNSIPKKEVLKERYGVEISTSPGYVYTIKFNKGTNKNKTERLYLKMIGSSNGYYPSYTPNTMMLACPRAIIIQHYNSIPSQYQNMMHPYLINIQDIWQKKAFFPKLKDCIASYAVLPTIYGVVHRSQMFELFIQLYNGMSDFSIEDLEKLQAGEYNLEQIPIANYFIDINGINIPIVEELEENKIIFYRHNFDRYKEIIEKQLAPR